VRRYRYESRPGKVSTSSFFLAKQCFIAGLTNVFNMLIGDTVLVGIAASAQLSVTYVFGEIALVPCQHIHLHRRHSLCGAWSGHLVRVYAQNCGGLAVDATISSLPSTSSRQRAVGPVLPPANLLHEARKVFTHRPDQEFRLHRPRPLPRRLPHLIFLMGLSWT
jgi:hypothetical protein